MAKRLRTTTAISVHHPRIPSSILLLFVLAFVTPAAAQTNSFPLYSSGVNSGGSGDNTNMTNPQLKLQATSGYNRISHVSANSTISAVYNFETGKDVLWGEVTDVGNYWFRGRNLMVQNGKVGINYNNPQWPLEVGGHVSADDFIISNKYGSGSLDLSITGFYGASAYDMIAEHTGWDPNAVFIAGYNVGNTSAPGWAVATQRVFIGSPYQSSNYMVVDLMHGSVGIGTSNTNDPNNRLFVETGIRTRKVTVDQAAWPDYVFNPGYRLMPLDSLNRFIAVNHHLLDMPFADSVAKN